MSLVASLVASCLVFSLGAAPASNQVHFTIWYEHNNATNKIVVDQQQLLSNWWDYESRLEFTRGRTLFQRAQLVKKLDYESLKKHFPELAQIIARIEREVFIAHCDGRINFDPDRGSAKHDKFWVSAQKNGQCLDIEKLAGDILGAILSQQHSDILARVVTVAPKRESEILEKIVLRSSFFTKYEDNAPRECNISLAMEAFDGLVIPKGETVSFNDVVGPRIRARGYQEAKIIVDGEFVPGVGGGVCQASTTVFNAVLLSGLKIIESHNHSLPISYVPLGRDAMVSSVADLRFKNDTDDTLYVDAKVIDNGPSNKASVRIYGAACSVRYAPRVEVKALELQREIQGEIPKIMQGMCFNTGIQWFYQESIIAEGRNAKEALTYLDVFNGDELVHSKLVRKSKYKGKPRIVEYRRHEIPPQPTADTREQSNSYNITWKDRISTYVRGAGTRAS